MKLLDNLKYKINKIKWSYQRIRRGYSDWDVSEIDTWFLDVVPNMLKDFKKTKQGIPNCIFVDYFAKQPELGTYENFVSNWDKDVEEQVRAEWNKILDRTIYCFTEADEDKSTFKDNNPNATYEEEQEYYDKMLKEGLDLFYEYFHNLWN